MSITLKSDIDVTLIQKMGGDEMIAASAWVSTTAENGLQRAAEKPDDVAGVINYLMKHRHGSPFECGAMTFYVHAPIFVWREWHRHRIASYNETSARYQQLQPTFYIPKPTRPMLKVDDWKPGRPKFMRTDDPSFKDAERVANYLKYDKLCRGLIQSYTLAYRVYEDNLAMGFDPGLARDCLPVGIYSSCWVTVNPRALMGFLSLRHHDPDATFISYPLWEIDVAAQACEKLFAENWPITHAAFVMNGRVGP